MDELSVTDYLPHRYPFLMVDRVIEIQSGKSIIAVKNVSYNEPFFQGHFPQKPVMPGVLIIEAMAQATGILAFKTTGLHPNDGAIYYLASVDKVRFKHPVVPGDQLFIYSEFIRSVRNVWKVAAYAKVGEVLVASAELMVAQRVA